MNIIFVNTVKVLLETPSSIKIYHLNFITLNKMDEYNLASMHMGIQRDLSKGVQFR